MLFVRSWVAEQRLPLVPGMLVLRCDYNPEFVEALEKAVPASDREYRPAERVWVIHKCHEEIVWSVVLGGYLDHWVLQIME